MLCYRWERCRVCKDAEVRICGQTKGSRGMWMKCLDAPDDDAVLQTDNARAHTKKFLGKERSSLMRARRCCAIMNTESVEICAPATNSTSPIPSRSLVANNREAATKRYQQTDDGKTVGDAETVHISILLRKPDTPSTTETASSRSTHVGGSLQD